MHKPLKYLFFILCSSCDPLEEPASFFSFHAGCLLSRRILQQGPPGAMWIKISRGAGGWAACPPPRTHHHLLFHGKELEKLWLKLNVLGLAHLWAFYWQHPAWQLCSTNTDSSVSADPSSVKLESKEELCFVSRQAEVQHGALAEEASRVVVMLEWEPEEWQSPQGHGCGSAEGPLEH